ncbi:MAG: antibiotic biosynthesis monooxygenase [Candidatus Acidiferrum sp.]|jgi:heme-degrading monooxygenase HmoA
MFVVLWEFDVKSECEDGFILAYSPSGAWAQLFATHAKFRKTQLLRDIANPLRFVTMDVWESREDYEHFLQSSAKAYRELDALCEGLTTRERHLSSFDADKC